MYEVVLVDNNHLVKLKDGISELVINDQLLDFTPKVGQKVKIIYDKPINRVFLIVLVVQFIAFVLYSYFLHIPFSIVTELMGVIVGIFALVEKKDKLIYASSIILAVSLLLNTISYTNVVSFYQPDHFLYTFIKLSLISISFYSIKVQHKLDQTLNIKAVRLY